MSLRDRILKIASYKYLSVREFEKVCGLKRGNISNMGDTIGADKLAKIHDAFPDVNIEWLLNGVGEFLNESDQNGSGDDKKIIYTTSHEATSINDVSNNYKIESDHDQLVSVPLTDVGMLKDGRVGESEKILLPRSMVGSGEHACLRINGIFMSPTFQDSSYVVFTRLPSGRYNNLAVSNIYLIYTDSSEAFIRRFSGYTTDMRTVSLVSDNPDKTAFPDTKISVANITDVWEFKLYISKELPHSSEGYASRIRALQDDIENLKVMMTTHINR